MFVSFGSLDSLNNLFTNSVYSDVPKAFERWTADNIKVYIYSSGSVAAQKLLFTNSEHGDLTSNISGYFDTNVGLKQEQLSYEKIVKEVGCEPSDILFLTDIVNGRLIHICATNSTKQ